MSQPNDVRSGLTSKQADELLREVGPNTLVNSQRPLLIQLLAEFWSPITVVLLVAAAISVFVGNHLDAALIGLMVLSGTLIDFAQSYRSQKTINKLRASVASTATIMRDGKWCELARANLVPGDLIKLAAGDMVPADARLLDSRGFFVQQAALTGESGAVEKTALSENSSTFADAENMVFLGTSVMNGFGTAVVIATGSRTAYGRIAVRLAERPMETAFDRGLKDFSLLITKCIFVLVLSVLIINLVLHRTPLESLLFSVALAVGLTPDFLPMITSVILARGASRLAGQDVVVKNLRAIQNLGGADVFCTDKTGTITSGQMTLNRSVGFDGFPSHEVLALGAINSKLQDGIASPLDASILNALPDHAIAWTKIDEIPFDFARRRVSVVAQDTKGTRMLVCKGAPEYVLPLITSIRFPDGIAVPQNDDLIARTQLCTSEGATQGRRVLAVASSHVTIKDAYQVEDECDLTLEGYLEFEDLLLPETTETISALHRDGVRVVVITGDNDLVARSICNQAGLPDLHVCLGAELESASDTALLHLVEENNVFARVSPDQKLRIVNALKRAGHTVAFMGDGVNDAPALHAADVGIAAPHAVDVAREAADVVFMVPGLKVLHLGVQEGRKAFGNVMKYLLMGTSSNFGNVLSMAAAALFLPFLPMLPTQVLLNNFLYDLSQLTIPSDNVDDSYYEGPQRWDIEIIKRFMLGAGPVSSLFDFLTFFILLHILHSSVEGFRTAWFIESLVTQTLVLLVIRTSGAPWRSRPSAAVAVTVILTAGVGVLLTYIPLGHSLQFQPLPLKWMLLLAAIMIAYLASIELVKRIILKVTIRGTYKSNQRA